MYSSRAPFSLYFCSCVVFLFVVQGSCFTMGLVPAIKSDWLIKYCLISGTERKKFPITVDDASCHLSCYTSRHASLWHRYGDQSKKNFNSLQSCYVMAIWVKTRKQQKKRTILRLRGNRLGKLCEGVIINKRTLSLIIFLRVKSFQASTDNRVVHSSLKPWLASRHPRMTLMQTMSKCHRNCYYYYRLLGIHNWCVLRRHRTKARRLFAFARFWQRCTNIVWCIMRQIQKNKKTQLSLGKKRHRLYSSCCSTDFQGHPSTTIYIRKDVCHFL